ncbi:MAG: flagellar FlbD family protein [Lachnospiraceae bacterium]|nr:flagellar FlbD family protein [Lachnospiraceae bacterium]
MIELTKLDGVKFLINEDYIETVEETPDSVVTLSSGRKIIVKEGRQEIKNLVKSYRKDIYANL